MASVFHCARVSERAIRISTPDRPAADFAAEGGARSWYPNLKPPPAESPTARTNAVAYGTNERRRLRQERTPSTSAVAHEWQSVSTVDGAGRPSPYHPRSQVPVSQIRRAGSVQLGPGQGS